MEKILAMINAIYKMPDELELLLLKTLRRDSFKKKHKILKPGQTCVRLYFIEKGVLRCYIKKKNKDITSRLMEEEDIAIAVISYFTQAPSEEGIEVLRDCILWSLSKEELESFYEKFQQFRKVGQVLTEKYYCADDKLKIELLKRSTGEFYSYMLKTYPELVRQVPNKHLATQLGVTVQTFLCTKRKRKQAGTNPKS